MKQCLQNRYIKELSGFSKSGVKIQNSFKTKSDPKAAFSMDNILILNYFTSSKSTSWAVSFPAFALAVSGSPPSVGLACPCCC